MPLVFISYSWDDEDHKHWVLKLANKLVSDGIDVRLDRYELSLGKNLTYFIDGAVAEAEKILIIFTPQYKAKANKRINGVGYEFSIINSTLYKNIASQEKVIPILRLGNVDESIPDFIQQFIHLDLRNDDDFDFRYNELVKEIYNERDVLKPALGERPRFDGRSDEEPISYDLKFLPISKRLELGNKVNWLILDEYGRYINSTGKEGYGGNEYSPYPIKWFYDATPHFSCGLLIVEGENGCYGCVNEDGQLVIDFEYEDMERFSQDLAAANKNGKWGLIDKSGKVHLAFEFERLISPMQDLVFFRKYGKWGICDMFGHFLMNRTFNSLPELNDYFIDSISQLFANVFENMSPFEQSIDLKIKFLAVSYGEMFQENASGVEKERYIKIQKFIDERNFNFLEFYLDRVAQEIITGKLLDDLERKNYRKLIAVQKDKLFGFKDENGKLICDYLFEEVTDFLYNRAFVRLPEMEKDIWFVIDVDGNILCNRKQ